MGFPREGKLEQWTLASDANQLLNIKEVDWLLGEARSKDLLRPQKELKDFSRSQK